MSHPMPPRLTLTTRLKNVFIVLFFSVQFYMALPGFLYNQYEIRGNFSWNMYSIRYPCWIDYELVHSNQQRTTIDFESFFNNDSRAYLVFDRQALPKFNSYLCREHSRPNRTAVIFASATCRLNYEPAVEFIQQDVNMCTAPNYGVLRE